MAYIKNIPSAVADDKIGVVEGTYCAVIGRNVAVIVRPWRSLLSNRVTSKISPENFGS